VKDALEPGTSNTGIVDAIVKEIKSEAGVTYANVKSDSKGMVKLGPFAPRDNVNITVEKEGYSLLTNLKIIIPKSTGTEESPATVTTQQVTLNPDVSSNQTHFYRDKYLTLQNVFIADHEVEIDFELGRKAK
jgi:hypothetical protein